MNKRIDRKPTRRRLRRAVAIVGLLLMTIVAWHVGYRLTCKSRAVQLTESSRRIAPAEYAVGEPVSMLAWNIAHGRGLASSNWDGGSRGERRGRLDDIAETIIESGADIIVLNEVDFNATWSHGVNQAVLIARSAGFRYVAMQRNVDVRLPFFALQFGNAVLSKYPITETRFIEFPQRSAFEWLIGGGKQGLACTIQLSDTVSIDLVAVHLDHKDEVVRVDSVEAIRSEFGPPLPRPVILAGDFNSTLPDLPGARTDKRGRNAMAALFQDERFSAGPAMLAPAPTIPSDAPILTIDWIIAGGGASIVESRVRNALESDHLPVSAIVTISHER